MGLLNRETILAAIDWSYEEFEVPKWGGTLRIRALSAKERLQLAAEVSGEEVKGQEAFLFFAKVVCLSVVDGDGTPVFELERDYDGLMSKDWDTLTMVANRIMEFNGMSADAAKELGKN